MLSNPLRKRYLAQLVLAVLSSSCSALIDTSDRQCDVSADCARLGDAFTGASCVDSVCVAEAVTPQGCESATSPDPTVTLSFEVSFATPPREPKPFTVRACGRLDPECLAPLAPALEVPYGDRAEIVVPTGFAGLLEVTNPDGLPALEFLGRPIFSDTRGYDLIIPTPATVQLLLALTQQDYDPEQGIFVITTRDCDRSPLAGVQVSNTQGGVGFYFQGMLPQKSFTETTTEGAAGFVNVPPGLVSVGATYRGKPMTPNSAISRGGWVSYVEVFP